MNWGKSPFRWYMNLRVFEMHNDGLMLLHLIPVVNGEESILSQNIFLWCRKLHGELEAI